MHTLWWKLMISSREFKNVSADRLALSSPEDMVNKLPNMKICLILVCKDGTSFMVYFFIYILKIKESLEKLLCLNNLKRPVVCWSKENKLSKYQNINIFSQNLLPQCNKTTKL